MDHASLWLTNTGDVLTVPFKDIRNSFVVRVLIRIGEFVTNLIATTFYHLGRLTGAIHLGDDIERTLSHRSRLLWEEARRRSIDTKQLFVFGLPTDIYAVTERDGDRTFYQSIPFPDLSGENADMDDKVAFKRMLEARKIPVPRSRSVMHYHSAKKALDEFGIVCVKPQSGSNGRHTFPYVRTEEELRSAFKSAKELCLLVSIEEHLEGNLARATCVGGTMHGFLESAYPTVTGDGFSTVRELVARANAEKPEGVDDILLTDAHMGYIRRRGYEFGDILPAGVPLQLTYRAGASSGGRNTEHGRSIHPSFLPYIEEAARATGLPIVGFDLIIPDPTAPADSQQWGFIEANSLPWIDLHATPLYGTPVDLSPHVWALWEARDTD